MARSQSDVGGSVIGMVIFAILFVITLLLSIVFFTQKSKALTAQKAAQTQAASATRDMNTATEETQSLKSLVAGDEQISVEAIQQKMADLRLSEPTLFGQIQRLQTDVSNLQNSNAQLGTQFEDARKDQLAAQQRSAGAQSDFTAAAQELLTQLNSLGDLFTGYQAQAMQMQQTLQQQMADVRGNYETQLRDKDDEIGGLSRQVGDLMRERPQRSGSGQGVPAEKQPDGQILTLMPQRNLVTINRGLVHQVILGLTFEVFDDQGVVVDSSGTQRGHATIEVVRVDENSSVARVVAMERNAMLREGNIIANVVYDPQRTYKFYIFGDFDLDGIGEPTMADRRLVESKITRWGGRIADQLDYDTDFLLLGVPPFLPQETDPQEINPVVLRQYQEDLQKYDTYHLLVDQARELSIPVLNQNRFLALIGHYQR